MGMDLSKANQARLDTMLSKQINSSTYGIVTWKEFVERRLADGGRLEVEMVRDDAAQRKAEREYESMRRSSDWVPTGNPNHPRTIRYNSLKAIVDNPPNKPEYRIYSSNGGFAELPKMLYDWAAAK